MANRTLDDYCSALRTELHLMRDMNASSTSLSNRTIEFWKSSRGTVVRIEVLVVVITIMQLFLVIFGSWRRRSRNFFIQKGVLVAYTLSSSLVSYTVGSMQSSAIQSNMYAVWAISMYILFDSADSITAYSLTDNDQFMRQIFQFAIGYFYMFFLLVLTAGVYTQSNLANIFRNFFRNLFRTFPLMGMMSIAALSFFRRLGARQVASASWSLNKMVADYMYQEHTMGEPPYLYDPGSMRGYHYLVDWPLSKAKLGPRTSYVAELSTGHQQIIDIEKVWQNNGSEPLLSTDVKDACLSFSLFHLLRRRFFGFECGESSQPKTHDFVFKGLLAKKQNPDGTSGETAIVDYDRVFKVIEVEMAFMYDFFFTKYAVIYYGKTTSVFRLPLFSATLTAVTAFLTAGGLMWPSSSAGYGMGYAYVFQHTTAADVGITVAILVCISVLEVVQMLHYWTTIWARVSFACQLVRGSVGFCVGLKERFVQIGVAMSGCWWYQREKKLGQYSLFESVSNSYKQCLVTKVVASYENMFLNNDGLYVIRKKVLNVHVEDDLWRVIWKPGKPATLLPAVKKALVQSLGRTQGKLTNGESSMLSNGADDLLWACKLALGGPGTGWSQKQENQVCVILTWHIATCYCDKELAGVVTEDLKEHHEVATTLSNYTAYLVGFQPKLLPGHHYDTWLTFMVVATEAAKQVYPDRRPFSSRTVQVDSPQQDEETIYKKGLMLGEHLKNMEATRCWKVLADFWAEMLLYLAPSDNVKEHVECLAKGGELITHLWALLTHAGILDRGKRNNVTNDTENPGDAPSSHTYSGTSTTCAAAAPSTWDTNQPSATSNPSVQRTERDVGETRDSGTDQSDPRELSYGAAWRLRQASSYLDKCAEGAASATYRATNEPAMRGTNCAQTVERVHHQPANPVQNGAGARNEINGLSEIEEIA